MNSLKYPIVFAVVMIIFITLACISGNHSTDSMTIIKQEEVKAETKEMLSKQDYLMEISPIFTEMGIIFSIISKSVDTNNLNAFKDSIKKLKKLNNELQELKEPKEFSLFAEKVDKSILLWEKAYIELEMILNGKTDAKPLLNYIDEADKLINEATSIMLKEGSQNV